MCGEQVMLLNLEKVEMGSPPRVRGTAGCFFGTLTEFRITPACAGNSFRVWFPFHDHKDHPRVCGEQSPL